MHTERKDKTERSHRAHCKSVSTRAITWVGREAVVPFASGAGIDDGVRSGPRPVRTVAPRHTDPLVELEVIAAAAFAARRATGRILAAAAHVVDQVES